MTYLKLIAHSYEGGICKQLYLPLPCIHRATRNTVLYPQFFSIFSNLFVRLILIVDDFRLLCVFLFVVKFGDEAIFYFGDNDYPQ